MTARPRAVAALLERRQVPIYLLALAVGAVVGTTVPGAGALHVVVEPVLAVLLYATFLGVPLTRAGRSLRDGPFLAALGVTNLVLVPAVVALLSRPVVGDPALLVGLLLVLLTPCVDYVIVFARLAGGAADRLLAAAPLLTVAQVLLLPPALLLFLGPAGAAAVEVGPFVRALVVLVLVPLAAAAVTQVLAQRDGSQAGAGALPVARVARGARVARRLERATTAAMVPLMALTLVVVVASQSGAVGAEIGRLAVLVPLYAGFVVVMVAVGLLVGRARAGAAPLFDVPARRALVFSGVTRNSLVVLPLALALPPALELAPLAVVTQTLVELVAMVVLVRLVPRLVR